MDGERQAPRDEVERETTTPGSDVRVVRRDFLRGLGARAVVTAGELAGSARMIQRAAAAGGEAALRELDQVWRPDASIVETAADPGGSGSAGASGDAPDDRSPGPASDMSPDAVAHRGMALDLTPDQVELLEHAPVVVLGTIQPGGAPQLSASPFSWDGRVFRLSGLDWTARTQNIQVDPRVSLTIVDPGGYLSVTVAGRASIVGGPAALDETRPILEKATRAEAEIAARWAELNAGGDRVAIIVVPERMVWQETAPGLRADRPARWMGQIESEDSRVDGRAPRSGTASDERSG